MHTRTQKGEVYRKGKKWYLRYFDFRVEDGQLQRKRLCKVLCSVADMNKDRGTRGGSAFPRVDQPIEAGSGDCGHTY